VSGAEYYELASWVRKRLDEVFPDDAEPAGDLKNAPDPGGGNEPQARGAVDPDRAPGPRIGVVPNDTHPDRAGAAGANAAAPGSLTADSSAKALQMAEIRRLFRKLEPPVDFWEDAPSPGAARHGSAGPQDVREIGARVRERLEEVFPDDSVPTEVSRAEREGLFADPVSAPAPAGASKSLVQLRGIAGAFQPGPFDVLDAYARELERLLPEFEGERHMLVLIELQLRLCRYMGARFRAVHRQAATTLLAGLGAMERLASDSAITAADRRRVFEQVLGEFKSFNRSLSATRSAAPPRTARADVGRSPKTARQPAPQVAAGHVDELREFLRQEFRHIENLLLARLRRP